MIAAYRCQRTLFEGGRPIEECAKNLGTTPNGLYMAWSRLGLTHRVVPRGHESLRVFRLLFGLTQKGAALHAGISERSWRRYERGELLVSPGQFITWVNAMRAAAAAA